MTEKKTYTLTQLTKSIQNLITKELSNKSFWITCEISSMNEKGGHRYIELVDSKDSTLTAKCSGTIWKSTYNLIKSELKDETEKILKSGNKVLILVEVDYHQIYGLKLNIKNVDPTYTYGDIEARKQESIKRLTEEKLLDKNKQTYLPKVVQKIGIIGSADTSGYKDIIKHLDLNPYGQKYYHQLFSTSVQGDSAVSEIIKSLRQAQCFDFDVLALIRGGGSKIDLDVFNNFELCKTIANCRLPVLTGVGHETDISVCDLVSYMNVKTPTAVADFIIVRNSDFIARMENKMKMVILIAQKRISNKFELVLNKVGRFKSRTIGLLSNNRGHINLQDEILVNRYKEILTYQKNKISSKSSYFESKTLRLIQNQKNRMSLAVSNLQYNSQQQTDKKRQILRELKGNLGGYSNYLIGKQPIRVVKSYDRLKFLNENILRNEKTKLINDKKKIKILDPNNVVTRGYSITRKNGKIQGSSAELKNGDIITTKLKKMEIESVVNKIHEYEQ